MAIFKCKMCGGSLEINPESRIATCEYCGSEQTIPKMDSEKKENLYDRADHFRRNNDYDKAIGIYEQILIEDKTDAEAYWSLVLCDYGIEYVEDPKTHDRIPTINRTQYTSIYADANYKSALEYASIEQKDIYEKEAQTIDEIQKGILEISKKEKPYDVFICYKESDEAGNRTKDSVLANDLYHQLTQEGFKVFFSRITLEDKLGQEYEPYIFAALNSAKVMVVLGTKPEHFKAVWVKNEWSRYLSLIKKGENKILVPAYKDMDPYDLPEEFSHLQAQDMSKLGFMQDLIRGIKKIINSCKDNNSTGVSDNDRNGGVNGNTDALLKRGYMSLEDGEYDRADEFFEEVLNQNPECGEAYLGKLFSKSKSKDIGGLKEYYVGLNEHPHGKELYACDEDEESINEAIKKYSKYITEKEIRSEFDFDRTYSSFLEERELHKKYIMNYLSEDKLIKRARQYGDENTKNSLAQMINSVEKELDDRIISARKEEEDKKNTVIDDYKNHIMNVDKILSNKYVEYEKREELLYKKNNEIFEKLVKEQEVATSKREYDGLAAKFDELGDFEDAKERANQCRKKSKELLKADDLKFKKKMLLILGVIGACLLVITAIILIRIGINSNRAERIKESFNGKTFVAEGKRDMKDMPYSEDKSTGVEEYHDENKFNEDTKYYSHYSNCIYDDDYVKYCKLKNKDIRNGESMFNGNTKYEVKVDFWGDAYIDNHLITLDDNDMPISYSSGHEDFYLKE